MSKIIQFRVDDQIYDKLAQVATEQEGSVNGLAKSRTLRTLGITPDGLTNEWTISLTDEEDHALTRLAQAQGCPAWEVARQAVLGFLSSEGVHAPA